MKHETISRLAALLIAAPLAACTSLIDNETLGSRPTEPAGGSQFASYAAIGTSIGAGIQSGGINDSTQREAYTTQLALAMGLTPGVDWFYPSLAFPGCPPPFTNPLINRRLGGGTGTTCLRRTPGSAAPFMHNTSIPGLRIEQALDLTVLDFPATDTLKLAQFITGSIAPIDMVERARPTYLTVEVGSNDVLGAATRGDASLLTPIADAQAALTALADRIDAIPTLQGVAIAGVPNVTRIPHFTSGATIFCLKTGACGFPANVLFTNMTVDASCAPTAPGVGSSYLLPFATTAAIVGALQAGSTANLNCGADVATITPANTPAGATVNTTEYAAITSRVAELNTAISGLATSRGYAFVDFDALLAANAASIPAFPAFTTPSALFGTLFSLDGIHPAKAGHRLIAQAFATAINTQQGTSIAVP